MVSERDRRRLSHHIPKPVTVAVLAFVGLCSAYMYTLVVPIQAELPALLNASREDTAWVVTATLLMAAIATPIAGRLGDMYGKRRIVLVLLVLLVAGSVVTALAQGVLLAIVGRALQGAATGVVPLGISIMRDILPQRHLGTGVALMSATLGVGGAIGMPLSAFLAEHTDWHVLFWVAAGLGVLGFTLTAWLVPPSVLRTPGRFDFIGAIGFAIGLVGVLLAVSRGAEWGWASAPTLGCAAGGLVILLLWGRYQLRAAEPLIDLRVAARPAVLFTNIAAIGMGFALFASNVTLPQLLELPSGPGFGLSLFAASLIIMPSGMIMMLISPISGWLERTVGPRVMFTAGNAAVLLSYVYLLIWSDRVAHLLVVNFLLGIGIGLSFAAMPMLIMRAVPASETGVSNGINALCRSLGTASAAAVMAAVLAAISVDHDGVTVPTAEAFTVAFWIAAAAAAAGVVLTLFIPRHPPPVDHAAVPDRDDR